MKYFGEWDLVHAIYMLLLDDEFLGAYENGILIRRCSDGITRRVFPKFFVYSVDYPEKCVRFFINILRP